MNKKMLLIILGLGIAALLAYDSRAAPGAEDLANLEAQVEPREVKACDNVKASAADILEARYLGLTRKEQMGDNLFLNMIAVEAYELPVYDGQANRDVQIEAFSAKWQEKCLSNPEVTEQ